MGTFDSVYLNKIRRLEEENQQLRNILNEYEVSKNSRFIRRDNTPIDGRGAYGGRGINPSPEKMREWWKETQKNPKIDKSDLSKVGSGYDKEYILGQQPKKKPGVPVMRQGGFGRPLTPGMGGIYR